MNLQRNTRNPYSNSRTQQRNQPRSQSRNPYAAGAGSAPRRSSGSTQRPTGSTQRPVNGSRNPYARAAAPVKTGSRRPQTAAPAARTGGALDPIKLGVLAMALLLVVVLVICAVKLFGRSDDNYAYVPEKIAETFAPLTETAAETEAEPEPTAESEDTAADAPQETALPEVAATDEPKQSVASGGLRSARIRSIGDFVIHEPIYKSAKLEDGGYDFSPMLSYIKDSMGDADYTVANVDGPMGGPGKRGYKGYPQFNTPPHLMLNLLDAGVDMLTLANNHALDTYFDGLKAEIEACISCGMDYVGAARTREESKTPVIKEINGIKVGFLNYTHSTNTMENHSDKEASEYGLKIGRFADFEADAKAARDAGAEVLVAYMHWGDEYERNPGSNQQHYGKKLVAAGVDVIIGGHPHVVQPAYWLEGTRTSDGGYQRTLCLSSLGNFLSDQRQRYRDAGIIFDFTIQEIAPGQFEFVDLQYVPTYVWRTGSEKTGFEYRVVPCGPYLEKAPEGMDAQAHARLVEAWYETIEHMNTGNANTTAIPK